MPDIFIILNAVCNAGGGGGTLNLVFSSAIFRKKNRKCKQICKHMYGGCHYSQQGRLTIESRFCKQIFTLVYLTKEKENIRYLQRKGGGRCNRKRIKIINITKRT
jgi:hypothetical protein